MKTLTEFNREQSKLYETVKDIPIKNNIACSECGEELWDSSPNITLASYSPKKNVHCNKCGFVGYRIA